MKRLGIVTLALAALLPLIAAASGATRAGGPESGKLRVVCTTFPRYDFLAGKTDELGLKTVMALEGSDRSIANAVIANTAARGVREGAPCLSIMESNLNVLKEALR